MALWLIIWKVKLRDLFKKKNELKNMHEPTPANKIKHKLRFDLGSYWNCDLIILHLYLFM